jgi:homoserine kinase type II
LDGRDPCSLGNAGGLSGSSLWRFRAGLGELVLRAWPVDGRPREAIERVHGWVLAAAPLGFVPAPLAGLDGRTLYEKSGRLCELTPWMPGDPEVARPLSVPRLRSAFSALAAFHQALGRDRVRGTSPGISRRRDEAASLIAVGFDSLERSLTERSDDPHAPSGREWLTAARTKAGLVLEELTRSAGVVVDCQPCLRDARPEHFLFQGDRVSGLVDFGAMGVDTVAADLGRLLSEWLGDDTARRGSALEAYAAVRPLEPAETALVAVFERSAALLGGWHWARWHFLEGRVFNDSDAVRLGLARGIEQARRIAPG